VTPAATTVERIDQRVILVDRAAKSDLLAQLLRSEPIDRVLVFTRTKHGADKVVRALAKSQISSEAIHGNKSQNQRERVLAAFRTGKVRTLVATDIAARGIDVEGISHVVNFDLPNIPESYVHRIGRTARAGAEGVAISFCDGEERAFLRDIEKLIRIKIPSTDQRGVRHAAPQPVAGAVASPTESDAAPATDWSPHGSPRANGHGKKHQQNRPRQNKPHQGRSEHGRSEQGRSEQGRSEQPRKPHAAQPQQARNGDQQEQPQRNGQHHQQARNGQHPPKRNGQHPQPRNGQPHQAKRNGHQHQQNRSPSQPAGDGSIATVGFMKPTQRQKHHSGGLAARRSAR
jgi:ATP-dependent RNA helicase RhlE